jgi:hypothetical protein
VTVGNEPGTVAVAEPSAGLDQVGASGGKVGSAWGRQAARSSTIRPKVRVLRARIDHLLIFSVAVVDWIHYTLKTEGRQ